MALLELWGTKLAVVSACDSGAGELVAGEGVMGLRRAFVQAGARDLLLTLYASNFDFSYLLTFTLDARQNISRRFTL